MSLLGAAGMLAVALVLLAAGIGHLRDPRELRSALAAHAVLAPGTASVVAAVLGPVELLLAAALLVGPVLPFLGIPFATVGPALLAAAAGATLLLAGCTAYLAVVLRRTRGGEQVPCGCGLGRTPVGHWAVARAGLLAALGLLAVVAGREGPVGPLPAADQTPSWAVLLVTGAAGLSLAIAVAALPAARAVPRSLTTLQGGAR